MNTFINYCIETNMVLLLLTCIYFILFAKETQFTFRRWFLLTIIAASLIFPLIEFQQTQTIIPSISDIAPSYLPEVSVSTQIQDSPINYWDVALYLYCAVTASLLLLFIIRIGKLIFHLRSCSFVQEGKFKIIESTSDWPTFSFFNFIFIGGVHELDASEKEQIINHEKLHASKIHSLDLLIGEALKIVFWFNPVSYIIKNQLVSIHEYEADQQAIKNQDADAYCDLLARASLSTAGFSLANHFHNSLTLKRIIMINTKKTKMKNWKYVAIIPAFTCTLLLVACSDQINQLTKTEAATNTADEPAMSTPEFNRSVQKHVKYPKEARLNKEQGKVFISIVVEKDGQITNPHVIQGVSSTLDQEALEAVKFASTVSPWTPGRNKGHAVKMKMILPVEFILDGVEKPTEVSIEPDGTKATRVSITGYY